MDGNHGNSTCTHQHLASQRNRIYSTISTLLPAAALHLNTSRHQHVRSFDTDSVKSDFLLLIFTYRCPIYQTSVDTVCEEMVAPQFNSSKVLPSSSHAQSQYQCSRLYRPFSSLIRLVFLLRSSLSFQFVLLIFV